MNDQEPSINERAEQLMGRRPDGTSVFYPYELGYACPICDSEDEVNLNWSEYQSMIWCKKCNLDIPSCLCLKYYQPRISGTKEVPLDIKIKEAIRIFLDSVESAISKAQTPKLKKELDEIEYFQSIHDWIHPMTCIAESNHELPKGQLILDKVALVCPECYAVQWNWPKDIVSEVYASRDKSCHGNFLEPELCKFNKDGYCKNMKEPCMHEKEAV